ncbi:MAG: hypothetical protein ABIN37_09835 [Burkholderiaceae bacterium]
MRSLRAALIGFVALLLVPGVCGAQSGLVAQTKSPKRDTPQKPRAAPVEARLPPTSAELAIALQVQVGRLPCELGQEVELLADPQAEGYFRLVIGKSSYRVAPQETTTGAVRLEDKAAGIVWLQLANKSMLMDQKQGRRLADECKSTEQARVAQEMLINPPPSILESADPVTPPRVIVD